MIFSGAQTPVPQLDPRMHTVLGNHGPASEMLFKWRFASSLLDVYWVFIDHTNKCVSDKGSENFR